MSNSRTRTATLVVFTTVIVLAGLVYLALVYVPSTHSLSTASNTPSAQSTITSAPASTSMGILSGSVTPAGEGTRATTIIFIGSTRAYTAPVTNGSYSIFLPSPGGYLVSVKWQGNYSWQSGSEFSYPSTVDLAPGNGSAHQDFVVATPDSIIKLSGRASTFGIGTHPTSVLFVYQDLRLNSTVNEGNYSIGLPNMANYSTTFAWSGSYPWQKGVANSTDVLVDQGPGMVAQDENIAAAVPNSLVAVSGAISTPQGETPTMVIFSANGLQFTATPRGGTYSIQLANLATYTIVIKWSNPTGSGACSPTAGTLGVELGPGVISLPETDLSC
jgi:hypothetical protein